MQLPHTTPDVPAILRSLASKGIPVARLSDANLRELGVTREQLLGTKAAPAIKRTPAVAKASPATGAQAPIAPKKAVRKAEAAPAAAGKGDGEAAAVLADKCGLESKGGSVPAAKVRKPRKSKAVSIPEREELSLEGRFLPPWCRMENLRFKVRFDVSTPSNNELRHMHFAPYKKLRDHFGRQAREALGGYAPPMLEQSALYVVRYKQGAGMDWDNALGGLKPALDCLVAPSKRNPSGVGIIVDDNPGHMPYPPFMVQNKARRKGGSLEIFVFTLTPADVEQARRCGLVS